MSEMDQIDVLAECLEALENGRLTVAQCLAQYPQHQASLQKLLPLAETLLTIPETALSPLFRQQARHHLLKQLPPPRLSLANYFMNYMHSFFKRVSLVGAIVTLLVSLLLVSSGVALAANSAVPGDVLYGLDRSLENVRLRLAGDRATAVALQTAFAQERLSEATQLAARGDTVNVEIALNGYRETMAKLAAADNPTDDERGENMWGGNGRPLSVAFVSGDCTYSQGYWKNHPGDWPIADLILGEVAYTQAELLVTLHAPARGDATYILAHQLIAAHLNIANGAEPSPIATDLTVADDWLAANPLGSNPTGEARQAGSALAGTLDSYNNGRITPTHCDEIAPAPTAAATKAAASTTAPPLTPTSTIAVTVTPTPLVTLTPTITSVPTDTPTPTIIVPPTITPTVPIIPSTVTPAPQPTDCTGAANPHLSGTTLANRFGVPYEEIMGWFCAGFGFGEIEQAYNLSADSGVPVADIFAMRQSGKSWGQIRQALTGDNGNNGSGNGNGNGNDNGNNGNGNGGNSNNSNNGNGNGNGNSNGNGNGNNGNNGSSNNGSGQGSGNSDNGGNDK